MICKFEGETRILKYVDPLTGPKKILIRREGRWDEWGSKDNFDKLSSDLTITDRGAILIVKYKKSFDQRRRGKISMKFADPMRLIRLAFVPVLLLAQFLKYNRFSAEIPSLTDDPEEMS